jgi:protein ImuB
MPQPAKTLSLFPGEPKPPSGAALSASQQRTSATWIAVSAPSFGTGSGDEPDHALRSLAIWSRTLTPAISFAPPNALLLEVQSSLRLFGGLAKIKSALTEQARRRLSNPRIGIAPTANGALWLSRQGNHEATSPSELSARLRSLPISVTGWPHHILTRLEEMGILTVGEVLRLPREGLARRIGIVYLQDLDKALGKEVDLRPSLELPESLRSSIDLMPETADRRLLLEAVGNLFERCMLDLRCRQRQIGTFMLHFQHLHGEPSREAFALLEPAHEKQHFLGLVAHRLERVRLRAPVVSIELETGHLLDMRAGYSDLFPGARLGRDELSLSMIERLRERLGPMNVHGIALVADHRPESAWSKTAIGRHRPMPPSQCARIDDRPLWLLDPPRTLQVENGHPFYHGALSIQAGPERIESGWWDQRDISRDYFVASGESGEKLWVYLDNDTSRWYLHGFFG